MTYSDRSGRSSEVPQLGSRVRVPGREEVGVVVDSGRGFDRLTAIAVHFASTGEVAYYDRTRVEPAKE